MASAAASSIYCIRLSRLANRSGIMNSERFKRVLVSALLLFAFSLLTLQANAQLSARGSVRITATLHGRVSLGLRSFPLLIALDSNGPASNYASFPLDLNWNLNPREVQGFEVIGYFANAESALVNASDHSNVSAQHILGRWASDSFQPFNQTNKTGTPGASLNLFSQPIMLGSSRGARSGMLELKIDPETAAQLSSGEYRGVLYVEVRHY